MACVPERGHIVHLQFDPSSGREMKGPHYGFVVSSKEFNQHGLANICPISQGFANVGRTMGTIVTLMGTGTRIQGAVHCHQLKSLDWRVRKTQYEELVPDYVIDEVLARVEAIISG